MLSRIRESRLHRLGGATVPSVLLRARFKKRRGRRTAAWLRGASRLLDIRECALRRCGMFGAVSDIGAENLCRSY
jgi:hypothetical protein